jgi:hypothetical protein
MPSLLIVVLFFLLSHNRAALEKSMSSQSLPTHKAYQRQTALFYAESWLNSENVVVKKLLNNLRNQVNAHDEKKKNHQKKGIEERRKRRAKAKSEKRYAGGLYTMSELKEAGKALFMQKARS